MIIKYPLLDRALEVARAGKHKIRVYTNDYKIFEIADHIDNLQKKMSLRQFRDI